MGISKKELVTVNDVESLVQFYDQLIKSYWPDDGVVDSEGFSKMCYWGQNILSALNVKEEKDELNYLRKEISKLTKMSQKGNNMKRVI